MSKILKGILGILFFVFIIYFYFGGGLEHQVAKDMQNISNIVAEDQMKQYDIAKNTGNKMDAYIQAGFVAAAYLQAKDELNYQKWKNIQKQDGKKIGMPSE